MEFFNRQPQNPQTFWNRSGTAKLFSQPPNFFEKLDFYPYLAYHFSCNEIKKKISSIQATERKGLKRPQSVPLGSIDEAPSETNRKIRQQTNKHPH